MSARRRSAFVAAGLGVTLVAVPAVGQVADRNGASDGPRSAAVAAAGAAYAYVDQTTCAGAAVPILTNHVQSGSCGYGALTIAGGTADETFAVEVLDPVTGASFAKGPAVRSATTAAGTAYRWAIRPDDTWRPGRLTFQVVSSVNDSVVGTGILYGNALGAVIDVAAPATGSTYRPGQTVPVSGTISEQRLTTTAGFTTGSGTTKAVPATYRLRTVDAQGKQLWTSGVQTAGADGSIAQTLPAEATATAVVDRAHDFTTTLRVETYDVAYTDGSTQYAASTAGAGAVAVAAAPTGPQIDTSFVSSVGWVKPGEVYPFKVLVRNYASAADDDVTVSVPAPVGAVYTTGQVAPAGTTVSVADGAATWTIPSLAGTADAADPTLLTLTLYARAESTTEDPQVVWKDLSATATVTGGGSGTSTTHGPHVIPPNGGMETARYGDRPFPVVPVDYFDFQHDAADPASLLEGVINDPANPGSTFNLYQEMSLGQLFPNGTVPAAEVATSTYTADQAAATTFTTFDPASPQTCTGITTAQLTGQPSEGDTRIDDGWYRLPGMRGYYGADANGSALVGAEAGVGALQSIDSGCGSAGKLAYDAAAISDPDIDFNDYDTDKDGVVDFFEVIFQGVGGNGVSQLETPPYDNIWPHSSSLLNDYTDATTGITGYVSHDQLKNFAGEPLWYTTDGRNQTTTTDMGDALKDYVRVGPYNVNPEDSIEHASVISHEYGHSLGLPDFYSTGSRETYGDWNIMATDHSHDMSGFPIQDMGWIVPDEVPDGTTTDTGFTDSKLDTHTIHWQQPDGTPYTLTGPSVHNAKMYTAALPGRRIIDPAKITAGASPSHVWWSQSGNDFGCAPEAGHNLAISLESLKNVPAGTPVTMTMDHAWETEWDFDYAFVLIGKANTDGSIGSYTSVPDSLGYTTPATMNANTNSCQSKYGNSFTGSSASYEAGTQTLDRQLGDYPDFSFVHDSFDISGLAGTGGVLVFSYATDPGLAKTGWFVDNVEVTAGDTTVFSSDFENGQNEDNVYPGGCDDTIHVTPTCTKGWQYVDASATSPADHAYYLEMRDRSGFDFDGHGQDDRANGPAFAAGLLLEYTDESHGYGNVGTDDPPAQSPLDAVPDPGNDTPDLDDAAFKAGQTFSDAHWVDNYTDPTSESTSWEFNYSCLGFTVDSLTGATDGPQYPGGPGAVGVGGDLVGTVTFTKGDGCALRSYGYAGVANTAPTALAQVKAATVSLGSPAVFSGSQSYDDSTAPSGLTYAWSFGDGTTATGSDVQHTYAAVGTYPASLTVTDADGLVSAASTVTVTVVDGPVLTAPATGTVVSGDVTAAPGLASTGLGPLVAVAGLVTLAAGLGVRRLRRQD